MSEYIDIGVNLTGRSFRDDLEQVVQRAAGVAVNKMIVTGTNLEHSRAAIELCQQYPDQLYATVGIHPHHADDFTAETITQLEALSRSHAVVAIGECGLDYNRNYSEPAAQRRAFEAQLALAAHVAMPVFLHQRDAHKEFVGMIRSCRPQLVDAVAHCFTGSAAEASDYLELDMYIGITGWICDERRGKALRLAVKEMPLDRVLLETDAPYLLPRDLSEKPMQSRRNEPCFLPHIARVLADCMNVDIETLSKAVYRNTLRFFRL